MAGDGYSRNCSSAEFLADCGVLASEYSSWDRQFVRALWERQVVKRIVVVEAANLFAADPVSAEYKHSMLLTALLD